MTIIEEIADERKRQVNVEGWSSEHDDEHSKGELALAAACYAAGRTIYIVEMYCTGRDYTPKPSFKDAWPWDELWWKPKDRRRDLIRSAALIVAEIDRLDRASAQGLEK